MIEDTGYEAHDDAPDEAEAAADCSGSGSVSRDREEEWCAIQIFAPIALKHRAVDEAQRRKMSMNDLALEILAGRYWIPVLLSGRTPSCEPSRDGGSIFIRVPRRIKRALAYEALGREINLTRLLIEILADALNVQLDLAPPRRRVPFGGGQKAA